MGHSPVVVTDVVVSGLLMPETAVISTELHGGVRNSVQSRYFHDIIAPVHHSGLKISQPVQFKHICRSATALLLHSSDVLTSRLMSGFTQVTTPPVLH